MSFDTIKNSANIKKNTIIINANNRTSGTETNFVYNLGTTITDVRLIDIKTVEIENNTNNINSLQNTFNWSDSTGVTHDTTLSTNNYNIYDLVETIQTDLNATEPDTDMDYTVTFDDQNKITFLTTLGTTSFDLNFGVTENSIANILGFSDTTLTGTTTYTSDSTVNLYYTKNFYIGSTNLIENAFDSSEVSSGVSNLLLQLPLKEDYGDILIEYPNINIRNKISSLSSIDIQLKDDNNNDLSLISGNLIITLDIYSRVFNNSFSI